METLIFKWYKLVPGFFGYFVNESELKELSANSFEDLRYQANKIFEDKLSGSYSNLEFIEDPKS